MSYDYLRAAEERALELAQKLAVAEWRIVRLQSAVSVSRMYLSGSLDVLGAIEQYSAQLDAMNAAGWLAFVGWWA